MKIILTEEQLKKITESTRISLNETRKPTRLQMKFAKSRARAIQNEFYNDYLVISKLYYKFSQFADNIYDKLYSTHNTWDDDNLKRKMAVIYNQLKEKLEGFGNKFLVNDDKFNELNSQMMNYIKEQIDTEDEENELMSKWYGDDSFDEYGSLDSEDDEDNEEVELDFNYAPEYDIDSDDSYDLSRENDINNRMIRSVRVGAAGAVDRNRKKYTIDGKEYSLTPIEYRQMLKDMGRTTPEKAANMGVSVDTSGVLKKFDNDKKSKIKYLKKRIKTLQDDLNRWEPEIDPNYQDDKLEWKVKYIKASLETAMDEYDELTGNVDGEEYNF